MYYSHIWLNNERYTLKSKKLHLIVFILVIFSLIKIDYRFQEIPYGLEVDDAEYYYSAVTIGIDFDLDFSYSRYYSCNRLQEWDS